MRSIFTKVLIAASLLAGGVASADNVRSTDARDHRDAPTQIVNTPARSIATARRDDGPPAPRFEKHRDRRGFVWVAGQWTKSHRRWVWQPGHFERIQRGSNRY